MAISRLRSDPRDRSAANILAEGHIHSSDTILDAIGSIEIEVNMAFGQNARRVSHLPRPLA